MGGTNQYQLEVLSGVTALAAHAASLDTRQANELTGISTVTFERWRVDVGGQAYVTLGRLVKYRRVDLDGSMDARLVG